MRPIGDALSAHRLARRSALYRWLHQHQAEISVWLATQVRPRWEALAATARVAKVVDATGKPVTCHAVHKAWKTLQADTRRTVPPKATPMATTERQPPALSWQEATPSPPDAPPAERKALVLRTARPLPADEHPDEDGSTLPKPFSRTKQ